MCGIVGVYTPDQGAGDLTSERVLRHMADQIARRGPDHQGIAAEPGVGLGLAHNRLAILDLSPAGEQPMNSAAGRFVMIYNGEVYNHLDIRAALEAAGAAPDWRGFSDSETLLAGFDQWGVESTLKRAIGMFAIAVWDRKTRELILARDRMGEKPLYYGWQGQGAERVFLFGSELAACAAHPAFQREINPQAIGSFLRHNYVPAPGTIYKDMFKLTPGHMLVLGPGQDAPKEICFWDFWSVAHDANSAGFQSGQEAVAATEEVLGAAVKRQMISDVPLGAFLSGGIDSTCITALMQAASPRKVKTFSIGFEHETFNEAEYAKQVAEHLGTDHHELYVTEQDCLDVVPTLASMYSEPFADSSQIPTSIVSRMARDHVTVALSGDAGDELFCGYTRYAISDAYWGKIERVPVALRSALGALIQSMPSSALRLLARAGSGLPIAKQMSNLPEKIEKAARMLPSATALDLYRGLVSHSLDPGAYLADPSEMDTTHHRFDFGPLGDVEKMMAMDAVTYLPDDILVKVDRAAMYHSLETRAPFLDHTVVEHAWQMPFQYKSRDGHSKWVLRELVRKHVPDHIMERPKMGFGVPLAAWLRGPLREWGEALLSEAALQDSGAFQVRKVRELWDAHQSGARNHHHFLWNFLMFQQWHESLKA